MCDTGGQVWARAREPVSCASATPLFSTLLARSLARKAWLWSDLTLFDDAGCRCSSRRQRFQTMPCWRDAISYHVYVESYLLWGTLVSRSPKKWGVCEMEGAYLPELPQPSWDRPNLVATTEWHCIPWNLRVIFQGLASEVLAALGWAAINVLCLLPEHPQLLRVNRNTIHGWKWSYRDVFGILKSHSDFCYNVGGGFRFHAGHYWKKEFSSHSERIMYMLCIVQVAIMHKVIFTYILYLQM